MRPEPNDDELAAAIGWIADAVRSHSVPTAMSLLPSP